MNVLVTGAAGYVGSFVAHGLVSAGHEVIALDNLVEGSGQALPEPCTFIEADVADTENLDRVFSTHSIDAVVHLAGFTLIPPSLKDPLGCFEMNVGATLGLLRSMATHGVSRMLFSSSAAVYGMPTEVPLPETHQLEPENPYGRSKLMIEQLLAWCLEAYGIRSVSFRYFNVAGAIDGLGESRIVETHLLPLLFSSATGQTPPIKIFGNDYPTHDGTPVRDYIHALDIADAHVRALAWLDSNEACEIFNLGSGRSYSVLDILRSVESVTEKDVPHEFAARRLGDPAVLTADITKAQTELGWSPDHSSVDEVVGSTWEWLKSHPHGFREAD
jgi:UDP-glucose 4-epimerase